MRPDRGLQIRRGALRRSRPGSTPAPSSTLLRARPSHLAAPGHGRSLPPMNLAGLPGALAEAVRSSASTPNRSCVPRMPRHAHPRPPPCSFRGVHRADRRRARVQIRPPAVPYAVPISAPASILAAPRSGQASDASSWPRARCAPPPDRAPRRRRRALVRQAVHTCVHSSAHTDTHSRRPPAELVRPHAQHHPTPTARHALADDPARPLRVIYTHEPRRPSETTTPAARLCRMDPYRSTLEQPAETKVPPGEEHLETRKALRVGERSRVIKTGAREDREAPLCRSGVLDPEEIRRPEERVHRVRRREGQGSISPGKDLCWIGRMSSRAHG